MRHYISILILILSFNHLAGQGDIRKSNCGKNSETWQNKYRLQETYIPTSEDPVKTVHCQMIIWQKDDGTGTWNENDPKHIERLRSMIRFINLFWSNEQGPSDSIPGVVPLGFSNIQFDIGLKFYRNSSLYDHGGKLCFNFDTLHRAAIMMDPDNCNYMNIHLVDCACKAGGCTNLLTTDRFSDQTIIMNSNHAAETDDWDDARNIAHELGHALGLKHLYNAGGPEPCSETSIDFLDDVMFPNGTNECKANKGCTHCYDPGGSCDPYISKHDLCDNNLMGGSADYKYLSPKQIGRCHRSLSVTNLSKYATGYSPYPWKVSQNETWDFEMKMYQDIVIESGSSLTIKCTLHMVDNARIIVNPGGKLIVDGGLITNGGNVFAGCNGLWKEISLKSGKVRLEGQKKKTMQKGVVEFLNGGNIEKCCNGIKIFGLTKN